MIFLPGNIASLTLTYQKMETKPQTAKIISCFSKTCVRWFKNAFFCKISCTFMEHNESQYLLYFITSHQDVIFRFLFFHVTLIMLWSSRGRRQTAQPCPKPAPAPRTAKAPPALLDHQWAPPQTPHTHTHWQSDTDGVLLQPPGLKFTWFSTRFTAGCIVNIHDYTCYWEASSRGRTKRSVSPVKTQRRFKGFHVDIDHCAAAVTRL